MQSNVFDSMFGYRCVGLPCLPCFSRAPPLRCRFTLAGRAGGGRHKRGLQERRQARAARHRPVSKHLFPAHHPRRTVRRSPASFGNTYGAAEPAQRGAAALHHQGGGVGAFGGPGSGNDPYAWAQRLREIPDEDALAELGLMGYTDGSVARRGGGARGRWAVYAPGERLPAPARGGSRQAASTACAAASRCLPSLPSPTLTAPALPTPATPTRIPSRQVQLCQRHRQQQEGQAAQLGGPRRVAAPPPLSRPLTRLLRQRAKRGATLRPRIAAQRCQRPARACR